MPTPGGAKMINLGHREKLMIAELKKSVSFPTGLKSQVEHVLVKHLRFCEIVNFDSNMVAAIDLNIHPPMITLILRASSVGRPVTRSSRRLSVHKPRSLCRPTNYFRFE